MARGPEAKIQDAVIKYARSKGLLCKKNEVGRYMIQSGWPDFMIFGPMAKMIFMEFKAPGKIWTPLQADVAGKLVSRRFVYGVIDDVAKGKALIDKEFFA